MIPILCPRRIANELYPRLIVPKGQPHLECLKCHVCVVWAVGHYLTVAMLKSLPVSCRWLPRGRAWTTITRRSEQGMAELEFSG